MKERRTASRPESSSLGKPAREERLRAEGMTEEQIAMIRDRISSEMAAHTADGWEVSFSHDHRATVQLFPLDAEDASEFERLSSSVVA